MKATTNYLNGRSALEVRKMTNKEKGTEYEKLVQSIYQTLLDADGFEETTVQHDTNLMGQSGCEHQIDVYWEYKASGQTKRIAIECKAYDKPVSIGRIRDFYGVLSDVPELEGIFVSLFGFQSGAKKYADYYGLNLKELRCPAKKDWEGKIENIQLNFIIISPVIRKLRPDVVPEFLKKISDGDEKAFPFEGSTDDPFIVDSSNGFIASIEKIRQGLPADSGAQRDCIATLSYPNCFLNSSAGPIPISGVTVKYDVEVEVENLEIRGQEVAKAIMKDVKSGKVKFFNNDGSFKDLDT